jgi:hypothetical protein
MIIRVVLAMAVTAAIATTARSQTPQGGMSGVGTIQVQPDVVPPLRSFRVQPETTPAIPPDPAAAAAPPAAEDASLSSPEAPRAQPRERTSAPAADVNRRHRGGAQLQAVAHRGKRIEHSEGITPDRAVARATDDPGASAAHPLMSRAQREAIVTAVMQDGKGVVPDASAPFPGYPVGTKVPQFSLVISPLPAGAIARMPQLAAYGYLVIHNRVLLVDPRTITVVADLAG